MLAQTILNGQEITYTLKRCKRKSIGLTIDHQGLRISVPLQTVLPQIETILREKAGWITKKLEQWENKKSLAMSWTRDAIYPLLGEPWHVALKSSGEIEMVRYFINETANARTAEQSLPQLNPRQIEKFVMAWYYQQAIACFQQRIAIYAQALNVRVPPFRLSRAKTRWGSCNSRGLIHLNWRLIQMPLHLVDYVVAHELAHLIEMNHSAEFWELVGGVYPGYLVARKELKEYG
ncbi:MAG: M48 family metallopeptidase [Nitrosomonas sp.]|uniref:M48 family metallopeptidase n=1 Tax=Nitrosomonas sp. TaxID=42353 RepID=UPI0025DB5957|nr:SprT family zinc-dependent metalloprotease [Nitrosomonas sp.]MBY0473587.1 M48 family metallopeptidase [Nitrosomonas sp.]